jgi:DNA-binding NtrC family response regulator
MNDKQRILVVDDEDAPRMVLRLELINEGYDVETANDGDVAMTAVEKGNFDLVLLDIKMPRVNGFDVLKFIKANHKDVRVIMMTSFSDLKSAYESEKLGAEGFVIKPYELVSLMGTIERVLKQPAKRKPVA